MRIRALAAGAVAVAISLLTAAELPRAASQQVRVGATPEWAEFTGQNDAKVAARAWPANLNRLVADTCVAVSGYPNVDFGFDVPRESAIDRISFFLPSSQLFQLVATDLVPARARGNPYARLTERFEQALEQRLGAAAPQSLEPAEVTRIALDVTGGSYPLAVLTAHNLLKTLTKTGRESADLANMAWGTKLYQRRFAEATQLLAAHNRVASRLKSLRPAGSTSHDKLGPWYHIYALLTIAALQGPLSGQAAAIFEHGAKWLKAFANEGGFNREKATIDDAFSGAPNCLTRGLAGNVSGQWTSRYGCAVLIQRPNGGVRGSLTYPNGARGSLFGRLEGRILYYDWRNAADAGDGKLWLSTSGTVLKGYFQDAKTQRYGDWSLTRVARC